ncbi:hypothetical protein D6D01_07749 [Aureobasidium pullulans]|uniref:Uncharacterized protein n=1 Tax=Aureobasidium pullulans TaxID=5580 RepID=A0A4V4JT78_AURPU|nr:hypothetical protein D6D01_07749 [Aureobasidium pullulans]
MSYVVIPFQKLVTSGIQRTCIGHVKDLSRNCHNPISQKNVDLATGILDTIRSGADALYVEEKIVDLAKLCLCQKNHQNQCSKVVEAWKSDMQEVPDGIDELYNDLLEDYKIQRRKLRTAKSKAARLELEVETLEQERADIMESSTHLRSELLNGENMMNALRQQIRRQQDENARLRDNLVDSQQTASKQQHTISSLEQDIAASHENLASSNDRIVGLENSLEISSRNTENARKTIISLRKQSTSLVSVNSRLQSVLEDSVSVNRELQERNSILESSAKEISIAASKSALQVRDLETQVESLKIKTAGPEVCQSKCGQRVEVLEALVKAQEAIHEIYQATTPARKSQLADTVAALERLQVQIQTVEEKKVEENGAEFESGESLESERQCDLM